MERLIENRKLNSSNSYASIVIYCILLSMLSFVGMVFQNKIFQIAALFLLLFSVVLDEDTTIMIYMFVLANTRMFMFNGATFISLYAMLLFVKHIIKHDVINERYLFISISYMVVVFITMFTVKDIQFITSSIKFLIIGWLMVDYFAKISNNKKLVADLVNMFIIGSLVAFIWAIMAYVLGKNSFVGRIVGINNDPNFYGVNCAVAMSFCWLMCIKSDKYQTAYFIAGLLMFLAGIASLSRTALLISMVNVLYFIMIILDRKHISRNFAFIIMLIVLVIIFHNQIDFFLSKLLDRFGKDDVQGGHGRFESWANYLSLLATSGWKIFFGLGQPIHYIKGNGGNFTFVPHNWYIDVLFSMGIVGVIITLMLFYHCFKKTFNRKKKLNIFMWLPFAVLLAGYATLSALNSALPLIILLLNTSIINCFGKEKNENSIN